MPGTKLITLILAILLTGIIMAQEKELAWNLYYSYENFKEQSLTNRRFKHSDIVPLIERLKNKKIFKVDIGCQPWKMEFITSRI